MLPAPFRLSLGIPRGSLVRHPYPAFGPRITRDKKGPSLRSPFRPDPIAPPTCGLSSDQAENGRKCRVRAVWRETGREREREREGYGAHANKIPMNLGETSMIPIPRNLGKGSMTAPGHDHDHDHDSMGSNSPAVFRLFFLVTRFETCARRTGQGRPEQARTGWFGSPVTPSNLHMPSQERSRRRGYSVCRMDAVFQTLV